MTNPGPKKGDLEPDLVIDLVASPETTDLTLVDSWRIVGRLRDTETLLIDSEPTVVVDPTDKWTAVVTHSWSTSETAEAGLLLVELEATWPGDRKQTFPTAGYIQVRIDDDLG